MEIARYRRQRRLRLDVRGGSVVLTRIGRDRCPAIGEAADVTVLENQRSAFSSASHGDIHHRSGQVVGTNHLVGEQDPKCGIDRAQEAIAEIRLPARLRRA
jgi:hypothetical protein